MADRQYAPLGEESAPAGWTLPSGLEIVPKLAYAKFDGTAAGSFQPCLRIVSDSGHVAAEYVSPTTVAAGGSADCTWFRGVAGSSGGSGGGGVPFAKASPSGFSNVPAISGGSPGVVVQSQTLDYNGDTSVFQLVTETFSGSPVTGIGVKVAGHYLVKSQIILTGMSTTGLVELHQLNLSGGTTSSYGSEGRQNTVPSGAVGSDGFYVEGLFSFGSGDTYPCGCFPVEVSNSTTGIIRTFVDTMVWQLDTDGTAIF